MEKSCLLSQHRVFILKYGFCHFFSVVLVFGKQSKCWSCNMRPGRCWKVEWTEGRPRDCSSSKTVRPIHPKMASFKHLSCCYFYKQTLRQSFFLYTNLYFSNLLFPTCDIKICFFPLYAVSLTRFWKMSHKSCYTARMNCFPEGERRFVVVVVLFYSCLCFRKVWPEALHCRNKVGFSTPRFW